MPSTPTPHNLAHARMAYDYDIFLSYKRHPQWLPWVRHFKASLEAFVRPYWRDLRVFLDETMQTGTAWRLELDGAVAHSRILIPVLTNEYFTSEWCIRELALFLEREQRHGYRTPANTSGLILPVQLFGTDFPSIVKDIQYEPWNRFAGRGLNPDSTLGQEFDAEMNRWAPTIYQHLRAVPDHEVSWTTCTGAAFLPQLRQPAPIYGGPPRLTP